MASPFSLSRVFILKKLCLVSLSLVYFLVIQVRYCSQNYFFNLFNLFNDSRRGWWCSIITDNTTPEQNVCIYIFWRDIIFKNSINIYYFHMVYLTISSEYLFFFLKLFYLSTWFLSLSLLSFKSSGSFHLVS